MLALIEQGDELGTDDGACSILLGGLEGLLIADAKAYHARIAQLHGVDAAEVVLLGLVEALLRAGDGCAGDHIHETIGVVVDKTDALLAGLGRDEHDDAQVVLVGNGLDNLLIVLEGQVGDDGAAHTALYARLAKGLDAVVQDGVEITHEYQRDVDLVLDGLELAEEQAEVHAILERLCGGTLNDGTIGQRIAEGDAYLDHGDATALHGKNHIAGALEGGTACAEIQA